MKFYIDRYVLLLLIDNFNHIHSFITYKGEDEEEVEEEERKGIYSSQRYYYYHNSS